MPTNRSIISNDKYIYSFGRAKSKFNKIDGAIDADEKISIGQGFLRKSHLSEEASSLNIGLRPKVTQPVYKSKIKTTPTLGQDLIMNPIAGGGSLVENLREISFGKNGKKNIKLKL